MEPRKGHSPAWHDISKAWKSVAELKEELCRAEEKLERVAKENFSHSYGTKSKLDVPSKKSHIFNTKGKNIKPGRGKNDAFSTRPKSAFERTFRTFGDKKMDRIVSNRHDSGHMPQKPPMASVKYAWTDEQKQSDKVPHLSTSSKKIQVENEDSISSVESKTRDASVNTHHSNFIFTSSSALQKKSKSGNPSFLNTREKIVFTDWEREFLHKELSVFEDSGVETDPQALKETEVFCVNDPIILPNSNNTTHLPKRQPIKDHLFKNNASSSKAGLQKLKDIVERQRENQDHNLSWNSDVLFSRDQNFFPDNELALAFQAVYYSSNEDSETDFDNKPTARIGDIHDTVKDIDTEIRLKPVSMRQAPSLGLSKLTALNGFSLSNRNVMLTSSDTGSESYEERLTTFPKSALPSSHSVEKKDAEVMVKPIPLRIVKHAVPPLEYKGFAAFGRKPLETLPVDKTDTGEKIFQTVDIKIDKIHRKVLKPKRLKKIVPVAKKEAISPSCWRRGRELILKTLGPLRILPDLKSSKTEDVPSENITSLSSQVYHVEQLLKNERQKLPYKGKISDPENSHGLSNGMISDNTDVSHTSSSKSDSLKKKSKHASSENLIKEILEDKENVADNGDDLESETQQEIEEISQHPSSKSDNLIEGSKHVSRRNLIKQIMEDRDKLLQDQKHENSSITELPSKKMTPKKLTPGKKRKATKQPQPEHRTPQPKIRHYDSEVVRKYIIKKRILWKKMQEAEKQNKIQAEQNKLQRLQQLYDFQKQVSQQGTKLGSKRKPTDRLMMDPDSIKSIKTVPRLQDHYSSEGTSTAPLDNAQTSSSGGRADNSLQEETVSGDSNSSSQHQMIDPVPSVSAVPSTHHIPLESALMKPEMEKSLNALAMDCGNKLDQLMSSIVEVSNVSQPVLQGHNSNKEDNTMETIPAIMLPHMEKNKALRQFATSIQNQIDEETFRLQGLLKSMAQPPSFPLSPVPRAAVIPAVTPEDNSLEEGALSDLSSDGDKSKVWKKEKINNDQDNQQVDQQRNLAASVIQAAFRNYRSNKQCRVSSATDKLQEEQHDSLSEGPLSSEDDVEMPVSDTPKKSLNDPYKFIKEKQAMNIISSFSSITSEEPKILRTGSGDWKYDIKPDPFNFISAWRKKQQELLEEIKRQKFTETNAITSVIGTTVQNSDSKLQKDGSWTYSSDFTGSANELSDAGKLPKEKLSVQSLTGVSEAIENTPETVSEKSKLSLTEVSEVLDNNPETASERSQKSFVKSLPTSSSSSPVERQKNMKTPKFKRKKIRQPSRESSKVQSEKDTSLSSSRKYPRDKDSRFSDSSNKKSMESLHSLSEGPLSSSSADSHHADIHSPDLSVIKSGDSKSDLISEGPLGTSEELAISKSMNTSDQFINTPTSPFNQSSLQTSVVQPLPKLAGHYLCPNSLGIRMTSELTYLDSLNDSLLQLSEMDRIHAVAVAEQNNVTLAHMLQEKQKREVLTDVNKELPTQPVPSTSGLQIASQTLSLSKILEQKSPEDVKQSGFGQLEKFESSKEKDSFNYSSDFEHSGGSKDAASHNSPVFSNGNSSISEVSIPEDVPSANEISQENKQSVPNEVNKSCNDLTTEKSPVNSVKSDISVLTDPRLEEQLSINDRTNSGDIPTKGSEEQKLSDRSIDNDMDKSYRMILPCEGHRRRHLLKKSHRKKSVSSASPASLSDQDTLSSVDFTSRSSIGASSQKSDDIQSLFSDDSFTQFTLDMVRRMTHEEELRARHQLALLHLQEKALVDKARAEMAWLKHVKKKCNEKGAEDKLATIRRRQHSLLIQLRQERAQLRALQESYHNVTQKNNKEKLAAFFLLNKSSKHSSSSGSSRRKQMDLLATVDSPISSLASCPTDDAISAAKDSESHSEVPEMLSSSNISSPQSVIETQGSHKVSTSSRYSHSSKNNKPVESFGTSLNNHSSHSLESILQVLKRLESGKRYMTKREQKLLQRRKDVEHLLHWQKQLDEEENAIRDMEKKALELVEADRRKRDFIIASSEGDQDAPTSTPSSSPKEQDTVSSTLVTPDSRASPLQESKEENVPYGSSNSVAEEIVHSHKPSTPSESMQEELTGEQPKSSTPQSKTVSVSEDIEIQSASVSKILSEEIVESQSKESAQYSKASLSGGELYSDSFESAEPSSGDQHNNSASSFAAAQENTTKSDLGKKTSGVVIRSPLFPRSHRRHDSSGSDDSYTISHSETASDQSDIEGRIHALSEELRRRQTEAEKLKREKKRRYREQLKETELSLQKQIEAYNHFIQQATQELEQEIEASFSRPDQTPIAVKPQIKQPRVAESRRLHRKLVSNEDAPSTVSEVAETSSLQKRVDDSSSPASSGTDGREASLSLSSLSLSPHQEEPKSHLLPAEASSKASSSVAKQPSVESKGDGLVSPSTSTVSTASSLQDSFDEWQKKTDIEENEVLNDFNKEVKSDTSDAQEDRKPPTSPIAEESEPLEDNFEEESERSSHSGDAEDGASVASAGSGSKTLEQSVPSVESDGPSGSHSTLQEELEDDDDHNSENKLNKEDSDPSVVSASSVIAVNNDDVDHAKESESFEIKDTDKIIHEECIKDDNNAVTVTSKDSLLKSFSLKTPHEKEHIVNNLVKSIFNQLQKDSLAEIYTIIDNSDSKPSDQAITFSHIDNKSKVSEDLTAESPKETATPESRDKEVNVLAEQLTTELLDDALKCMLDLNHKQRIRAVSESSSQNDVQGVPHASDVSKKVTSILASLEEKKSPREKTRPQDLMILSSSFDDDEDLTWKDVQPSAPPLDDDSENKVSFEVQAVIRKNDATNPVLGLKEDEEPEWFEDDLVVSTSQQEQQQLLLQQYQQLYYRQIPNKPPPPYTPPQSNANSVTSVPKADLNKPPEPFFVVPHTDFEVQEVVAEAVETLLKEHEKGKSFWDVGTMQDCAHPIEGDVAGNSDKYYRQFLFDLTREATQDLYSEKHDSPPPWLRPKKLTQKPPLHANKDEITKRIQKEVNALLKIPPADKATAHGQKANTGNTLKLGRKKRDFIDTILIQELKEEEPEWVNYNEDEVTVKMQLSNSIFNFLVDDTVELILSILKKRQGVMNSSDVDR